MSRIKHIVGKAVWGMAFMAAGTLILLSNHGIIDARFSFRLDWPVIFVLIGLSDLLDSIG